MLFRSVAKCSAYGTNAMHCTSKHRRCDTTTALVREIPETLFVPTHAEDDIFLCKSIEKHRNAISSPQGANGNDAHKLHAPAFYFCCYACLCMKF